MQSLARPRASMRAAASKPHSPRAAEVVQKRAVDAPCDDAQAAACGGAAGRLGTTAESVVGLREQKPLKPAWAVGLLEFTDSETGEVF